MIQNAEIYFICLDSNCKAPQDRFFSQYIKALNHQNCKKAPDKLIEIQKTLNNPDYFLNQLYENRQQEIDNLQEQYLNMIKKFKIQVCEILDILRKNIQNEQIMHQSLRQLQKDIIQSDYQAIYDKMNLLPSLTEADEKSNHTIQQIQILQKEKINIDKIITEFKNQFDHIQSIISQKSPNQLKEDEKMGQITYDKDIQVFQQDQEDQQNNFEICIKKFQKTQKLLKPFTKLTQKLCLNIELLQGLMPEFKPSIIFLYSQTYLIESKFELEKLINVQIDLDKIKQLNQINQKLQRQQIKLEKLQQVLKNSQEYQEYNQEQVLEQLKLMEDLMKNFEIPTANIIKQYLDDIYQIWFHY